MSKTKETVTKVWQNASILLNAQARCKAVLSVWTEKRKPAEVCKEPGLKWMTLHHWQQRALEGMLKALEPRQNL